MSTWIIFNIGIIKCVWYVFVYFSTLTYTSPSTVLLLWLAGWTLLSLMYFEEKNIDYGSGVI